MSSPPPRGRPAVGVPFVTGQPEAPVAGSPVDALTQVASPEVVWSAARAGLTRCPECAWLEGLVMATAVEPHGGTAVLGRLSDDGVVDDERAVAIVGPVGSPPRRTVGIRSADQVTGQALVEKGRLAEARVQFWHEAKTAERRCELLVGLPDVRCGCISIDQRGAASASAVSLTECQSQPSSQ